jgi:hypothetical protein
MFYKSDLGIFKVLINIYNGLKNNYDYVLVVTGDTGLGKSMFVLHLMETWQKIIGEEIDADLINHINVDKKRWLTNFKTLKEYDINVFDEGAKGLSSKQYNEKFSKLLEQLFQVIRFKKFFTVIVIPNFFRLDKYFREDRLRGLVYIDKRGHYKFFTRKRIVELTGKNKRLYVKNMNLVRPIHNYSFPDYKGVLRSLYDDMKSDGVDNIIDDTIKQVDDYGDKKSINDLIKGKVFELYEKDNLTGENIAVKLTKEFKRPISKARVYRILSNV